MRLSSIVERGTSHVEYSIIGRSAMWCSSHRRAEHAARRRYDAELDPPRLAEPDELREQRFVDVSQGDDDALDSAASGRAFDVSADIAGVHHAGDGILVELSYELDVDVAKELDLAACRALERSRPEDHSRLWRCGQPPRSSRDSAQQRGDEYEDDTQPETVARPEGAG